MLTLHDAPSLSKPFITCIKCGDKAILVRNKRFRAQTFKPYIEENFDGVPREITSAKHRDLLCKKHNLTYDGYSNVRKVDAPPAIDSIEWGDVKTALDTGYTPDGQRVEEPMTKKEAEKILNDDD